MDLIRSHRLDVLPSDPQDVYRIKVRRTAVWADTIQQLRRGLPVEKHLRVTFLGEPAVDVGGPLREYFHLLIASVAQNNSLFVGPQFKRTPAHSVVEVDRKTFYYVGVILAALIVYGGSAPSFFTEAVADFLLYGLGKVRVTVEDVPDPVIRVKLEKVGDRYAVVWRNHLGRGKYQAPKLASSL